MVLKVHECVFGSLWGAAYLHETLQLPWFGDKRPDYSSWHSLDWCCLNIVQPKSDPELLPFIFPSFFPLLLLSLSAVFVLFPLVRERGICVCEARVGA